MLSPFSSNIRFLFPVITLFCFPIWISVARNSLSMASSSSIVEHGTGGENHETFQQFFEKWWQKQKQLLQELVTPSEQLSGSSSPPPPHATDPSHLVQTMVQLCVEYHRDKSKCAHRNVLLTLSPPWNSSLKNALIWIGGWRPTKAVQVLYSKSGLQL